MNYHDFVRNCVKIKTSSCLVMFLISKSATEF